VVYVTDLTNAATLKPLLEHELHGRGRPELSVTFREARYTYLQLASWLNALMLGRAAGVVRGEIDERNNLVSIGILRESARATVLQAATALKVPAAALRVVVAQEPTPMNLTNIDTVRPLMAGLQIATFFLNENDDRDTMPGQCTSGPIVLLNGVSYIVTAAHCVAYPVFGGWDGGWVNQPKNAPVLTSARLGYVAQHGNPALVPCEVDTIPNDTTRSHFYQANCRYSDAALVQLSPYNNGIQGEGSEVNTDTTNWRGFIAQPYTRATEPSDSGTDSIYVNGIQLSGLMTDVFVGDTIEKVGRTTGWTAGMVTNTASIHCAPYDQCRLANVTVHAGVGHGDSGSPMFWKNSSGQYDLAGLLWGGGPIKSDSLADTIWYSQWTYVNEELTYSAGSLYFLQGTPPNLDPSMWGPTLVSINAPCTWYAQVSGGTSPYSFQWDVNGQGDQNPVRAANGNTSGLDSLIYEPNSVANPFTIYMTVWDAAGGSGTDSLQVNPAGYSCGS
jgi:hypothetical protein